MKSFERRRKLFLCLLFFLNLIETVQPQTSRPQAVDRENSPWTTQHRRSNPRNASSGNSKNIDNDKKREKNA